MSDIERQIHESIAAKERLLAEGGAETIGRMADAVVSAYREFFGMEPLPEGPPTSLP